MVGIFYTYSFYSAPYSKQSVDCSEDYWSGLTPIKMIGFWN